MIFAKKSVVPPPNFVHLHNEMMSLVIGVCFKVDAEKYITRFSFGINYNVKIIFSIMMWARMFTILNKRLTERDDKIDYKRNQLIK